MCYTMQPCRLLVPLPNGIIWCKIDKRQEEEKKYKKNLVYIVTLNDGGGEGLEIKSTPLHDLAGHLVHLLMEVSNGGLCVTPRNRAGCLYHSPMELSGAK